MWRQCNIDTKRTGITANNHSSVLLLFIAPLPRLLLHLLFWYTEASSAAAAVCVYALIWNKTHLQLRLRCYCLNNITMIFRAKLKIKKCWYVVSSYPVPRSFPPDQLWSRLPSPASVLVLKNQSLVTVYNFFLFLWDTWPGIRPGKKKNHLVPKLNQQEFWIFCVTV